ncbi:hypothetical protein NIES4073_79870 [Kalymmatonema gypsitolerans NIES-4073]|nr:hypothetical protein NIES4073_79870 [Scytonema sp. NIES-4073]
MTRFQVRRKLKKACSGAPLTRFHLRKKLSIATVVFCSTTGAVFLGLGVSSAQAFTISNGSLTVDIRNDNGAINSLLFGGSEFYREGTYVSDFGFQAGTGTSTFVLNSAYGGGQSVSVTNSSGLVGVTGTYTGGGSNINFRRTYSIVPGLNVLRVATDFINNGADTTLSYFDTFDPDQGIDKGRDFETSNDVSTLATGAGTAKVGQASESGGLTVVMGSLDPNVTVGSGDPFQIADGSALNNFFSSPVDGNGTFADQGTHVGLRTLLAAGSSRTFVYDQAFGETAAAARAQFVSANGSEPVPEPLTILGSLAAGGIGAALRRKYKQQQKDTAKV